MNKEAFLILSYTIIIAQQNNQEIIFLSNDKNINKIRSLNKFDLSNDFIELTDFY